MFDQDDPFGIIAATKKNQQSSSQSQDDPFGIIAATKAKASVGDPKKKNQDGGSQSQSGVGSSASSASGATTAAKGSSDPKNTVSTDYARSFRDSLKPVTKSQPNKASDPDYITDRTKDQFGRSVQNLSELKDNQKKPSYSAANQKDNQKKPSDRAEKPDELDQALDALDASNATKRLDINADKFSKFAYQIESKRNADAFNRWAKDNPVVAAEQLGVQPDPETIKQYDNALRELAQIQAGQPALKPGETRIPSEREMELISSVPTSYLYGTGSNASNEFRMDNTDQDGNVITTYPDGSKITKDKSGKIIGKETRASGTQKITDYGYDAQGNLNITSQREVASQKLGVSLDKKRSDLLKSEVESELKNVNSIAQKQMSDWASVYSENIAKSGKNQEQIEADFREAYDKKSKEVSDYWDTHMEAFYNRKAEIYGRLSEADYKYKSAAAERERMASKDAGVLESLGLKFGDVFANQLPKAYKSNKLRNVPSQLSEVATSTNTDWKNSLMEIVGAKVLNSSESKYLAFDTDKNGGRSLDDMIEDASNLAEGTYGISGQSLLMRGARWVSGQFDPITALKAKASLNSFVDPMGSIIHNALVNTKWNVGDNASPKQKYEEFERQLKGGLAIYRGKLQEEIDVIDENSAIGLERVPSSWAEAKASGNISGYVSGALGQGLGYVGVPIVATAATGGNPVAGAGALAVTALQSYGVESADAYSEFLQNQARIESEKSGKEVTVKDIIMRGDDGKAAQQAAVTGLINAGLDVVGFKLGAGKVVSSLFKDKIKDYALKKGFDDIAVKIARDITSETLSEGTTEAIQELSIIVNNYRLNGTEENGNKPMSIDDAFYAVIKNEDDIERIFESFRQGGITTLGIGSTAGSISTVSKQNSVNKVYEKVETLTDDQVKILAYGESPISLPQVQSDLTAGTEVASTEALPVDETAVKKEGEPVADQKAEEKKYDRDEAVKIAVTNIVNGEVDQKQLDRVDLMTASDLAKDVLTDPIYRNQKFTEDVVSSVLEPIVSRGGAVIKGNDITFNDAKSARDFLNYVEKQKRKSNLIVDDKVATRPVSMYDSPVLAKDVSSQQEDSASPVNVKTIEEQRIKELNAYAGVIVSESSTYEYSDESGDPKIVEIRTYKNGTKSVVFKEDGKKPKMLLTKFKKGSSNQLILDKATKGSGYRLIESLSADQFNERWAAEQSKLGKSTVPLEATINAKYDQLVAEAKVRQSVAAKNVIDSFIKNNRAVVIDDNQIRTLSNDKNVRVKRFASLMSNMRKTMSGKDMNWFAPVRMVMLPTVEDATNLANAIADTRGVKMNPDVYQDGFFDQETNTAFFVDNENVSVHEAMMHPIVNMLSFRAPELLRQFKEDVAGLINPETGNSYVSEATDNLYTGEDVPIEAIVNFLSNEAVIRSLNPSLRTRLADIFNRLLELLGLRTGEMQIDLSNPITLQRFSSNLAKALARGNKIRIKRSEVRTGQESASIQPSQRAKRPKGELTEKEKINAQAEDAIAQYKKRFPEALPLEAVRDENGDVKTDQGKPKFKKQPYALLNGAKNSVSKNVDKAVDILSDRIVKDYEDNLNRPEISAGIGWYSKMREWFQKNFGANIELFGQLLAATSAKTEVIQNFNNAIDALRNYSAGAYDEILATYDRHVKSVESMSDEQLFERYKSQYGQDMEYKDFVKDKDDFKSVLINSFSDEPLKSNGKKFNANGPKVLQALYGNWIDQTAGPKTINFAGNLTGRSLDATIDVWAARYMRRIIYGDKKQWRILPTAETGVQFNKLVSGELSGDYPFAERVMGAAAKKLNINADDLQAFLWYLEKDVWDKSKWTENKSSKRKASFEEGAATLDTESYQAGITTYLEDVPFSIEDFNAAMLEIKAEIASIKGVVVSRVTSSQGMFRGSPEPSFDVEFTVDAGTDVSKISEKVIEIGRRFGQNSVLFSKVTDYTVPNARPMVEIGLKKPSEKSPLIDRIIALSLEGEVKGYSVARDSRGRILGLRSQFVPEYEGLTKKEDIEAGFKNFIDRVDEITSLIKNDSEVSYINKGWVDTKVTFTNEKQENIEQGDGGLRTVEGVEQEDSGQGQGDVQGTGVPGQEGTAGPGPQGTDTGGSGTSSEQVSGGIDQIQFSQRKLATDGQPSNLTYSDIWNKELPDNIINSIRASLRKKAPYSATLQYLDELQQAKKNDSLLFEGPVNDMLENGVTLNDIASMLLNYDELFEDKRQIRNYLNNIGGPDGVGVFIKTALVELRDRSKLNTDIKNNRGEDIQFSQKKKSQRTETTKRVVESYQVVDTPKNPGEAVTSAMAAHLRQNPSDPIYSKNRQSINEMKKILSDAKDSSEIRRIIQDSGNERLISVLKDLDGTNNMAAMLAIELFKRSVQEGNEGQALDAYDALNSIGSSAGQLLRQMRELQPIIMDPSVPRSQRITTNRGIIKTTIYKFFERNEFILTQEMKVDLDNMINSYVTALANENSAKKTWNDNPTKENYKNFSKSVSDTEIALSEIETFMSGNVPNSLTGYLEHLLKGNLMGLSSFWNNFAFNTTNAAVAYGIEGNVVPLFRSLGRAAFGSKGVLKKGAGLSEATKSAALATQTYVTKTLPAFREAFTRGGMKPSDLKRFEVNHTLHPFLAFKQLYRSLVNKTSGKKLYNKDILPQKFKLNKEGEVTAYTPVGVVIGKVLEASPLSWPAAFAFRVLYAQDKPLKESGRVYSATQALYDKNRLSEGGDVKKVSKNSVINQIENATPEEYALMNKFAEVIALSDPDSFSAKSGAAVARIPKLMANIAEGTLPGAAGTATGAFFRILGTSVQPYVTVPSNLLSHFLEIAIPPLAWVGAHRAYKQGNYALGDQLVGRIVTSAIFYSTAAALISAGLVVSQSDDDDKADRAMKYQLGGGKSINLTGLWRAMWGGNPSFQKDDVAVPLRNFGMIGTFTDFMSRWKDELSEKGIWDDSFYETIVNRPFDEFLGASLPATMKMSLDMSFFSGQSAMLDAIRNFGTGDGNGFNRFVANTFDTFSNVVWANQYSQIAQGLMSDYVYRPENPTITGLIYEKMAKKMPWINSESDLYPVLDLWGLPVKNSFWKMLNPIKANQATDQITIDIWNLMAKTGKENPISFVGKKIGIGPNVEYNLDEADYLTLQAMSGDLRRSYVADIMSKPTFKRASDEQKLEMIKIVSDNANEVASLYFIDYVYRGVKSGKVNADLKLESTGKPVPWKEKQVFNAERVNEVLKKKYKLEKDKYPSF